MKKLIALFVFVASLSAQAALPPAADSLRYFRAIIDSPEVLTALNGQAVIIVQKNGDAGTYTVATRDCAFFVKVETVYTNPPMMVAPLQVSVTETHCAQR